MATTEGHVEPRDDLERTPEEPETSRDAWLEVAASDVDGGLAALATAARHGRPLPRG